MTKIHHKNLPEFREKLHKEICKLSVTIQDDTIAKMLRVPDWVVVTIKNNYPSKVVDEFLTDLLAKQDSHQETVEKEIRAWKKQETKFDNELIHLYNKSGEDYMTLDALQKHFKLSRHELNQEISRLGLERKHPSNLDIQEIKRLRKRDKEIIGKWLSKDRPTLQKLGNEYGITRERIRQIIKDAGASREPKHPKMSPEEIQQRDADKQACKIAGNYMKFWEKVKVYGENDCWEWLGYTHPKTGYGLINVAFIAKKERYVHRISWIIKNGQILNNLHVLHKCDNRICVNPNHLYLGTQADNNRDRDERYAGIPIRERKKFKVPRRKVTIE